MTAFKILCYFFEHMDKANTLICSNDRLQQALSKSEPTITRAIKLLREKNILRIERYGANNMYPAYIINPAYAWKDTANESKVRVSKKFQPEADTLANNSEPHCTDSLPTGKLNKRGVIPDKYKNKDFVQIYIPKLTEIADTNNNAIKCLFYFIKHMDKGNTLKCSYGELQKQFSKNERSIATAIRLLREKTILLVQRQESSKSLKYIVNPEFVWKDKGTKDKMALIDLFKNKTIALAVNNSLYIPGVLSRQAFESIKMVMESQRGSDFSF